MQCTNCNMEIPDNMDFCPFCGTEIASTAPQSPVEPVNAPQQATAAPQPQAPPQEPVQPQEAPQAPAPAAEPAPAPQPVTGKALLNQMIDKTNVPDSMKAEAQEMQKKAAELTAAKQAAAQEPVAEAPEQPMPAMPDMAQMMGAAMPATGQMPTFEQMMAYKVLSGEMTFEQMQQMVMMMNGNSSAPAQPATAQTPAQAPAQVPAPAQPVQSAAAPAAAPEASEEKEEVLDKKALRKKAREEKKRKKKGENTTEAELAKDEFYQNTAPEVDDPLPPSPWLRITRIVLLVILVVILVLCAIYYF